jgi:hypothetical protein
MSVVIDDLNVLRAFRGPHEAHAPLVVDADTVLAFAVTEKRLQAVPWGNAQVLQRVRSMKHAQFPQGRGFDVHPEVHASKAKQGYGIAALEGLDCHEY